MSAPPKTYPLIWRKTPWEHHERAGQRCRIVGFGLVEFIDGSRLEADTTCTTKAPRIKWTSARAREMRARIVKRAHFQCIECGKHSGLDATYNGDHMPAGFAVDHVKAFAVGGSNDEANLRLLCEPCNARKWCK